MEPKMGTNKLVVQSICLALLMAIVSSAPPQNPIKCTSGNTDCTITNAYGVFPDRTTCKAAKVAYPTTKQELKEVVATATQEKRKMKVTTRYSHSIPKLVCPDGEDGLLISTSKLTRILSTDTQSMTITVESGATLKQVIDSAASEHVGLALPYTPYWLGITIGGLLSTGSHGSTLVGKSSSVHDYVVALTIVSPGGPEDGYVKVWNLDENNPQINAARVSLGVLGVIYKVTLQLEPMFKRSITYVEESDHELGDKVASFGQEYEFGDIMWYPSQNKAVYRRDHRVSLDKPGHGVYDFIPFRSTSKPVLNFVRDIERGEEFVWFWPKVRCLVGELITTSLNHHAYGLLNDGHKFEGYPVIGYQNRLQCSGSCLDDPDNDLKAFCPWDPRINGEYFFETGFSIKLSDVKSFIEDVKNLEKKVPDSLCVLNQYNGILMRYVKASPAYLGKQEDGIAFDFTYYRSKDPKSPRLYEDILEEIEQIAVFKYNALPHWGKNRNFIFEGAIGKYENAGEFLRVKEMYDPDGLFSNEWTDQVLGIKGSVSIVKEGCALEGLCICSEDIHCGPKKGYFCKPGKIDDTTRVCTHVVPHIWSTLQVLATVSEEQSRQLLYDD